MNRRGFLKILAALPVIRHIPLPEQVGAIPDSPFLRTKYEKLDLNGWTMTPGGGGGGGGWLQVIYVGDLSTLKVTAAGGAGSNVLNEKTSDRIPSP